MALVPVGPEACRLSRLVQGYMRLAQWQWSPQQTLSFVEQHLELGISTVDHAAIYGDYRCEELFGQALALRPSLRDRLQIVSKCGLNLVSSRYPERAIKHYDTGAVAIRQSVEESLRRLGTDRLDLLLIHRPDPLMHADETAGALLRLVEAGKVLHLGVSNFTPAQFELLQSRLDIPLCTNQVEINPLQTSVLYDGTLDDAQRRRLRPMAWSPLAGGRPFVDSGDAAGQRLRACLQGLCEELGGIGADVVLLAWVMQLPSGPLPVLGSGRIERLRSAVAALDVKLTREQWFRVLAAAEGHSVP